MEAMLSLQMLRLCCRVWSNECQYYQLSTPQTLKTGEVKSEWLEQREQKKKIKDQRPKDKNGTSFNKQSLQYRGSTIAV